MSLLAVKVIVDQGRPKFYKFPNVKNLKQQWLLKIKPTNIQSIQHVRCVMLIALAEIPAGKRCNFS